MTEQQEIEYAIEAAEMEQDAILEELGPDLS
jgi:hypothetical protein